MDKSLDEVLSEIGLVIHLNKETKRVYKKGEISTLTGSVQLTAVAKTEEQAVRLYELLSGLLSYHVKMEAYSGQRQPSLEAELIQAYPPMPVPPHWIHDQVYDQIEVRPKDGRIVDIIFASKPEPSLLIVQLRRNKPDESIQLSFSKGKPWFDSAGAHVKIFYGHKQLFI